MPTAAADLEKPKATSAAVQAILDQIGKAPRSARTEREAEMDRLRRMAETVSSEIVNEEMIRRVGEAMEAPAEDRYLDPAAMPSDTPAPGRSSPESNTAARSSSPAGASHMQAYRENA